MKKFGILALAAVFSVSAIAANDDQDAAALSTGNVTNAKIAAGVIAAGVVAAIITNSRGDSLPPFVVDPVDPPVPVPTCTGNDPLVNGVCIGSRTDVIVTGTGTGTGTATTTTTISVPVTFTYAPTLK